MNNRWLDPRRLELLLELSRLGSMHAVSETLGVTTSTVSQQVAALAHDAGVALVEREGRRVRLTAAGRRLATHAVTVLAALEAARADLDPAAAPAGTIRVAAFASAVRQALLPLVRELAGEHPDVRLVIHEHEPAEALDLLGADEVDLALVYDYDLAPMSVDPALATMPLGSTEWGLGVPSGHGRVRGSAVEVVHRFREHEWIVNSRNTADEQVVATLASQAGFRPRIAHKADSLELVQDMVLAGLGVGLLPVDQAVVDGVRVLRLREPGVVLRAMALTRRGRSAWPPLALVLGMLEHARLR